MKRFWILVVPIVMMSCNGPSRETATTDVNVELTQSATDTKTDDISLQTVFSIERISKEEYMQAYRTSADYNIYPQRVDSIAQCEVLNRIFKDAGERIAALDSVVRCAIYEAVTDDELYCVDNLLYYPNLNLLGLKVPIDYHNNEVWWYDPTTGKWIRATLFEPTAVNTDGIYVCQTLDDCDICLDLHFFKIQGNTIYQIQSYMNSDYNGEYVMLMSDEGSDEEQYRHIFWHKADRLYLCSYDLRVSEVVFLKISLNPHHSHVE